MLEVSLLTVPLLTLALIACSSFAFAFSSSLSESKKVQFLRFSSWVWTGLGLTQAAVWQAHSFGSESLTLQLPLSWNYQIIKLSFNFDPISAVFFFLTLGCLVVILRFSRVYLHREAGFSRFFALLFLLSLGMILMSLADNLEVLFMGWESIGLASFFLISYYRHQKQSLKGALRILAVYRFGDLGLIFAVLLFHNLESLTKHSVLSELSLHTFELSGQSTIVLLTCLGIILAAAAKSAQFPFSFWLPRAMEGPTPSSAIFYGALSVHAGALLLLRLFPLLAATPGLLNAVVILGLLTACLASLSSRAQTSVKGTQAYASASQVGLIFAEIGMGWHDLALYHITAHALYRSYLILTSPSLFAQYLASPLIPNSQPFSVSDAASIRFTQRLKDTLWVASVNDFYCFHFFCVALPRFLRKAIETLLRFHFAIPLVVIALVSWQIFHSLTLSLESFAIWGALTLSFVSFFSPITLRWKIVDVALSVFLLSVGRCILLDFNYTPLLYFFVLIMPFFLLFLKIERRAFSLSEPRAFFNEKVHGLVYPYLLATLLACIPPGPTYFFEHFYMADLLNHSYLLALVGGVSFAINGLSLFRIAASFGRMGDKIVVYTD